MKFSRVLINGIIIFVCIALFFLLMEVLGLSDQIYLRLINFVFVIYGINRTIKQNYDEHTYGYFTNLLSAITTGIVSLVLGMGAFIAYAVYRGEDQYLHKFAEAYIFGGGDPSIYQFVIGLGLEGAAASVIVSFALMQYWKDKVEKINKVDDAAHRTSDI